MRRAVALGLRLGLVFVQYLRNPSRPPMHETRADNGEWVVKDSTLTVTVIKCLQYCNTVLIIYSCYVHVCLCMCVKGSCQCALIKGTTVEPLYKGHFEYRTPL